jgi:urocanate hydratase
MNSLDPAVAELPEKLIVCGGIGKLARDWAAFHAIANSLHTLADDETLAIRSGEPGRVVKTYLDAPRVLVVNPKFLPPSQDPRSISREPQGDRKDDHKDDREAGHATSPRATRMAADWTFTGPSSALPEAYETFRAAAGKHCGGSLAGRLLVAGGMGGMGGAQALAATLHGAAFLGIEINPARIKRRVKAGYCEVMVNNLDEALRILKNSVRKREPASVALIGNASEVIPELARRGVLPDLLTDETPADDPLAYIPQGLTMAQAAELRERDPLAYRESALDSMAAQVRGMLGLQKMGAAVFEFGNGIRAQALARGVSDAYKIPDFASEYLLPDLVKGRGSLTLIALSGDPDDLARVDAVFPEIFPDSELPNWIAIARKLPSPGLPARSCWIGWNEAMKLGTAINDLVAKGEIRAPVAIGHSVRLNRSAGLPSSEPAVPAELQHALRHEIADSEVLHILAQASSGASWFSREATVVVADGKRRTADTIERILGEALAANSLFVPPAKGPGNL